MVVDQYIVPLKENRTEMRVQKSRFISSLAPISSVEDARKFIQRIQNEFSDASHNVPAFIVGHGPSSLAHCSDDGEPSGSAGRPALAVLQGSGLGDAAVVITRYFGGTKLGIGGLVKAYGDAVREILIITQRAAKVESVTLDITYDYPYVDRIRLFLSGISGQIKAEQFTQRVNMIVSIPFSKKQSVYEVLSEMTRGSAVLKALESGHLLIPIDDNQ